MDSLPQKKYDIRPEHLDRILHDVRLVKQKEYKPKYVKRCIEFIDREHIKLKDHIYDSNSLAHAQYIGFVFNYYLSLKEAISRDDELAFSVFLRSYRKLIDYLNKTHRELSLASFYSMTLEKPQLTGMVLSHAAAYTIGSAFFILYASYMQYGGISEPRFLSSNGQSSSAANVAREILHRTFADVEKLGLVRSDNADDSDEKSNLNS